MSNVGKWVRCWSVLGFCLCCGALQAEEQTGEAFFETQMKSLDQVEYPQVGIMLDALSGRLGIEPAGRKAIYLPGSGGSRATVVIPLQSPRHLVSALFLYYYPETGDHFFLQIATDQKGAAEARLWSGGDEEILINESGFVLLPQPSEKTFRLPAGISKDLTPREILDCIAVFLGISLDTTSLENLILSAPCTALNFIVLGLTATNCLSIAGVGPNLAFATLGCVAGVGRLISCGILNCTTSACHLDPGHVDFCRADKCGPCAAGEGDCDGDRQCQSGLYCAQNVGASYGWPSSIDVCESLPPCNLRPGDFDFCRANQCGPCAAGEGDCDGDQECQPGLTCVDNAGATYGWFFTVDVCE